MRFGGGIDLFFHVGMVVVRIVICSGAKQYF